MASAAQWDAICGTSGGLVAGAKYYLSASVAGKLTTSAASGVAVVEGLSTTVGLILTGSSSGLSGFTNDGTTVATTEAFRVGVAGAGVENITFDCSGIETHQQISLLPNVSRGFTVLRHDHMTGVANPGVLQLQESIIDGTVDCSAGDRQTYAGEFDALATRVGSPGHLLSNVAILANASGGDPGQDYAFLSNHGAIRMNTADGATLGIVDAASVRVTTGAADFSAASAIKLGTNITSPNNTIPGDATHTPQLSLGIAVVNDGTQIQVKNTNPGQADSGLEVQLDTTVDANVRGGLAISRGAGGGGGLGGSVIGGLVMSSGVGFVTSSNANDLILYNQTNGKRILFSADGSGFTVGAWLDGAGELTAKVLGTGSEAGPKWKSNAGTPEAAVVGSPGDLCSDTTNGELYVKKSGAATNTGWKLVTHA
jgi:hypothetical protein